MTIDLDYAFFRTLAFVCVAGFVIGGLAALITNSGRFNNQLRRTTMASENIVPPFKVEDDGITILIEDANDIPLLVVDQYAKDETAFARELCTVMNENHKRLFHAANGEGEADNENTNKGE